VSRTSARRKIVPGGEQLFRRIYTRLGCEGRPPHFVVEFHPYADLTHTIRLRDDVAHVRLSDALGRASRIVIEAAAAILLGRLYRRRPPAALIEIYTQFTHAPATRRQLRSMRQRRGRRLEHSPRGSHHDLGPLFARLNREYFGDALQEPRLGWSRRAWRAQLGCFDPSLKQIVINRQLDHPRVPEYVVAYVLYHEMLHQKHPMRFVRCRRESHSTRFRNEEKRFTHYARAERFLARFYPHRISLTD
jgi:hypothetical protein